MHCSGDMYEILPLSVPECVSVERSAAFYDLPEVRLFGEWRIVPDTIIIVLGALPLLYFLMSTYPRLRKVGEAGVESVRKQG